MKRREADQKTTIYRFGERLTLPPEPINLLNFYFKGDYYIPMKNILAVIAVLLIFTSCTHTNKKLTNASSSPDPIALIFQEEIAKQAAQEEAKCRFIKVSPHTSIDAGIVKAEKPWEQEFILEAPEAGVEIGETTAECNSPLKITFIRETNTRFRLRVTIIPKLDKQDFKCVVKIPIFKEQGKEQLNLQITGKIRI